MSLAFQAQPAKANFWIQPWWFDDPTNDIIVSQRAMNVLALFSLLLSVF